MLQIDKPPLAVAERTTASEFTSSAELLASWNGFIRRQFPVVLFVALLTFGVGLAYVSTTPPRYTGEAKLIIDTRRLQQFQQPALGEVPVDSAAVESQIEILRSENIALSVIKDHHLTDDSEFVGPSGGLIGTTVSYVSRLFASDDPRSEFDPTRRALAVFLSRLTVKRINLTYVIDIAFESRSPERAAQIANAVADAYIVDQLEVKYQTTRRAASWLQDRLQELRGQASTADRAAVDFKAKNNIVETGGRLMNEQQLVEVNSALVQAHAQTAEAKARLDRIEEITRGDIPDEKVVSSGSVTDALANQVIVHLRERYLDYATREAEWSARYGRNHLAAVNLRNQMHEIRNAIFDELKRIAETYRNAYEIALTRENSVQKSLSQIVSESQTTNQAQVVLRELESSAQTYRALYDTFLQRYMESVQQQSFPITEARTIAEASPPGGKSYPKTLRDLALAAGGGLLLGLGLAMFRELSDRGFRTSGQIEKELQTDCIAVVPLVKSGKQGAARQKTSVEKAPAGSRTLVCTDSMLSYVIDSPFSRFAESIRSIKLAVDVAAGTKSSKVLGLTSSIPNEGKSTIATAFAQLTARGGARVVLVDGDLRNPTLSRRLAPTANLGILDVITGKAELDDVIWTDPSTNLAFLPAVVKSRVAHTNEILASETVKELFEKLRGNYDYVVVDLSPLAPVVDVRATTAFVDSYLLIVEWGRTNINVVEHALNSARSVYGNLLGIVLNKANIGQLSGYDGYDHYYNRHYARYGYSD
jgi:succinoglycan biosynthesis transport protein ExoP